MWEREKLKWKIRGKKLDTVFVWGGGSFGSTGSSRLDARERSGGVSLGLLDFCTNLTLYFSITFG